MIATARSAAARAGLSLPAAVIAGALLLGGDPAVAGGDRHHLRAAQPVPAKVVKQHRHAAKEAAVARVRVERREARAATRRAIAERRDVRRARHHVENEYAAGRHPPVHRVDDDHAVREAHAARHARIRHHRHDVHRHHHHHHPAYHGVVTYRYFPVFHPLYGWYDPWPWRIYAYYGFWPAWIYDVPPWLRWRFWIAHYRLYGYYPHDHCAHGLRVMAHLGIHD
ncbi:MAG: hypothetical protein KatS3mg119_1746 [Rhodothalassiaceae bacterium]|nr:MAG: hypothetical protein KatS3mg119_1746 [Rhodothalassiaceae bacterium]